MLFPGPDGGISRVKEDGCAGRGVVFGCHQERSPHQSRFDRPGRLKTLSVPRGLFLGDGHFPSAHHPLFGPNPHHSPRPISSLHSPVQRNKICRLPDLPVHPTKHCTSKRAPPPCQAPHCTQTSEYTCRSLHALLHLSNDISLSVYELLTEYGLLPACEHSSDIEPLQTQAFLGLRAFL